MYAALIFGKFGGILHLPLKTLYFLVFYCYPAKMQNTVAFLENVVCHLNSQSYSFDKEAVQGKGGSHNQLQKKFICQEG